MDKQTQDMVAEWAERAARGATADAARRMALSARGRAAHGRPDRACLQLLQAAGYEAQSVNPSPEVARMAWRALGLAGPLFAECGEIGEA